MKKHGFIFKDITEKSVEQIIKSNPDNPIKAIIKDVEEVLGKKIRSSGKEYGFEYKNYESDIDKHLNEKRY